MLITFTLQFQIYLRYLWDKILLKTDNSNGRMFYITRVLLPDVASVCMFWCKYTRVYN